MAKQSAQNNRGPLGAAAQGGKVLLGLALGAALPARRARMERLATIPWHDQTPPDAVDRLIRAGLFWRGKRDASGGTLARMHQDFWTHQAANEYYTGTQSRFEKVFLPHFDHYLDALAEPLREAGIETLVEIGCGDGQLLRHTRERLPLERAVGLDLSHDQIRLNLADNRDAGVDYHSGDAAAWIAEHAGSHTLYMTGLGVLEYFTQAQLGALLHDIAGRRAPAMALLIEPIDADADLDAFDVSYVAGEEHSFTHNYPLRLREAGWQVELCDEQRVGDYRWLVVLARAPARG